MESRTAKISFVLMVVGAVIWLGGINIRAVIGSDLLEFGTTEFKSNIHPMVERELFGLIARSSLVILPAYLLTVVSGIVFLKSTSLHLKQHGWLMMCALLFFIFVPVEIYTMILDIKMLYLDLIASSGDLVEYRKLFIHRLAALSGVPIIALFTYYTIIGLAIFQPLKKASENA